MLFNISRSIYTQPGAPDAAYLFCFPEIILYLLSHCAVKRPAINTFQPIERAEQYTSPNKSKHYNYSWFKWIQFLN